MRRRAPVLLVALGVTVLLGWYISYFQRVVVQLRQEAQRQSLTFAHAYSNLADPDTSLTSRLQRYETVLFEIVQRQREIGGVPLIIVRPNGQITDWANLDTTRVKGMDTAAVRREIPRLARLNRPISETDVGTLYYGDTQLVRGLRYIPALQVAATLLLVAVGLYAFLIRARADREHVWAGMARESAHQLGTPLSSISGWIALLDDELLEQGARADPMLKSAVTNMKADLERLERVAHRFERIGRPPRREPVDVVALVERMAAYFRARVPKGTHAVTVNVTVPTTPTVVQGDAVLLEWVIEALMKNAVDALAGRGGRIDLGVESLVDGSTRVRVADDGPGVPRELRRRIFEAGYSTKERGWGIGLSLARRIVEDNHGGRLALANSDRGAAFDVILR
jgi:signal transduction histidine kinase